MKKWLRDLFTFSAGERNGIIALVFVLIVICSLHMKLVLHHPAPVQTGYPDWMKDTAFYLEAVENTSPEKDIIPDQFPSNLVHAEKTAIDPNIATLEELILAGFSLRVSRTIIHYREKGGKFRNTGDLKKVYGLTPEAIQAVAGNIRIDEPESFIADPSAEFSLRININTADSVVFERLPGIGPVLARRIIRYRSLLGGYCSQEQIREVFGITDSLYAKIADRLEADTIHLTKINLNTADENVLARHPYIGKYLAAGIIQYRSHAGKISKTAELQTNGLIPKDRFDKLKYYFSL